MIFYFYLSDGRKRIREILDFSHLIYTQKLHEKNIFIIIKNPKIMSVF